MRTATRGAVRLLALALGGCAAAPVAPPPSLPTPLVWDTPAATSSPLHPLPASEFWAGFGSPALQDLLQQAALANPDLLIARDHLLIARDALLAARAQQQPSLGFTAGPVDTAATAVADSRSRHQAVFELGFNASYELDLWGRLDSLGAGAQAESAARAFDADSLRIGLMSRVAQAYFDVAQADDAEVLARRRLVLAEERLSLQTARQAAGRIDGTAVAAAQSALETLGLRVDQVRRQRRDGERQLALLLGRLPEGFALDAGPLRRQMQLPEVPAGLPSNLLQRRPDVRAAQARLLAAEHRSAAAWAERFPQVRLTAQLGVATDVLHRIVSGAVGLFGLGPELSMPIYDGGAREARLDASRREADIALLEYRRAGLAAFADVEKALALRDAARTRQQHADRLDARQVEAIGAVNAQLAAGRRSRLDAIAAEEQKLDAEQLALDSYRAQLDSLLALFEALGGGWNTDAPTDPPAPGEPVISSLRIPS